MITFDHLKLVRRDPAELRRYRTMLVSVRRGTLLEAGIEHEHDNRCCNEEAWPETLKVMLSALEEPTLILAAPYPHRERTRR